MTKPILSIIIPCYNSGEYLPDALHSIKAFPDKASYEVIIVDDGSTDSQTLTLLNKLTDEGYTVLRQTNQGPAAARNTGVKASQGMYLLLLDSDNMIDKAYIEKALAVFKEQPDVSVVHANPVFFGDSSEPRYLTGKFDLTKILVENYIDTCAFVRRQVWDSLGGQDENRLIAGHADWEFWIRVGGAGYKFHYIDEPLYHYRVLNNSLVSHFMGAGSNGHIYQYVYGKHAVFVAERYRQLYNDAAYSHTDQKRPMRTFIKHLYNLYLRPKNK